MVIGNERAGERLAGRPVEPVRADVGEHSLPLGITRLAKMQVDLLTVGRVNLDLYAQEINVAFADVTGWDTMVGGSGEHRRSSDTFSAFMPEYSRQIATDLVGDWVVQALHREGVETSWVRRKQGPHTSLALPPRNSLPITRWCFTGTILRIFTSRSRRRDDCRSSGCGPYSYRLTRLLGALRLKRVNGSSDEIDAFDDLTLFVDLDLRPVNWPDLDAYAHYVAQAISRADVILGTSEEFAAVLRVNAEDENRLMSLLRALSGPDRVFILKRGARGTTLLLHDEIVQIPARRVVEASSIGAGDSFAAGLIAARLSGRDWVQAAEFASICASITVSRFGCSRLPSHSRAGPALAWLGAAAVDPLMPRPYPCWRRANDRSRRPRSSEVGIPPIRSPGARRGGAITDQD